MHSQSLKASSAMQQGDKHLLTPQGPITEQYARV